MRLPRVVAFSILALCFLYAASQGEQLKPHAGQQEHTDSAPNPTAIQVPPAATGTSKAEQQADNAKGCVSWIWRWLPIFNAQNVFSLLLVLVGAGQIYLLFKIANLERPWVFVEIKAFDGFSRFWRAGEELMTLTLKYNLQNFGRTAAFCIDGYSRLDIFPVPVPDIPNYGLGAQIALTPLPQGTPNDKLVKLPITRDQHRALIDGTARLMFFGFIKYTDTSRRVERKSRWVAVFLVPKFVMTDYPDGWWLFEGPSAYTEYT